ncbi:GNAT family N-acetyltransferase [Marinobacter xiaoshiensis]|uniref:GNAT family N-acetyltransferase n=1 Tax=Marinobacter xiaoshiensis TaxID=3073652 RepID=A0ABU2HDU9_9GAMM|nr:GNAT family N-acetyltransferase [Marinobacter sp. F60267]MDS1309250.1 GNAT family N-acetyltransferase [Marinobacter sp. F60267]
MSEPAVSSITLEACHALSDIPRETWARLAGTNNPFLRYEFFEALEASQCTSEKTGWKPCHLIFRMNGDIAGVAPAYLKTHSMGEYVFDWAWADAYRRYGMSYYPKLLIAVPFTPSQGPRLLLDPHLRSALYAQGIHDLLDTLIAKLGAHSWHLLFPNAQDQQLLQHETQLHRIGCQFHWHNNGYACFDDFLGKLTSRKRKSIRKERRQVAEQSITFARFHSQDISDQVLAAFYVFYQATYLKRGQQPYLTRQFFEQMRETMPEHLHVIMAIKDREMIAGALFLTGQDTLYGRYWGCLEEYNHLHFETCYYQGIELAIKLGLKTFDAGAQGEHKLVRGFEPVITHSWHGIAHPGFRDAIDAFTREEAEQVMGYFEEAKTALPYRQYDSGCQ